MDRLAHLRSQLLHFVLPRLALRRPHCASLISRARTNAPDDEILLKTVAFSPKRKLDLPENNHFQSLFHCHCPTPLPSLGSPDNNAAVPHHRRASSRPISFGAYLV